MAEKYFTRTAGDEIIVTRKSDRKTIAFPRAACADAALKVPAWRIAIELAKACYEHEWKEESRHV